MDDENRLSRSVIHQDSSHKQDVTVSVTVHHGSVVKQTDVIVSITPPQQGSRAVEDIRKPKPEFWGILYDRLLSKWVQPSAPAPASPRKNMIAKKLWGAYRRSVGEKTYAPQVAPNRSTKKYDCCYILLLVWERDNIGGALKEAEALKVELEGRWGFFADIYKIPFIDTAEKQQEVVAEAISLFVNSRDGNANLLLFHYGGHGAINDNGEYTLAMSSTEKLHDFRLKPILKRLRECKADVGVFLDSCYAGAATHRAIDPHSFELLAACKEGNITPAVGPDSFTSGIIRVLHGREEDLNFYELFQELQAFALDTSLESEPIHHSFQQSLWGSITLRLSTGGKVKHPNVLPVFSNRGSSGGGDVVGEVW